MLTNDFLKKWYDEFASNVNPFIMDEFVKKEDCCPWHIFTYGKVKSK